MRRITTQSQSNLQNNKIPIKEEGDKSIDDQFLPNLYKKPKSRISLIALYRPIELGGFGFVEFEKREDAFSAITELHGTKYKGRDLTVEFSVSRETYERRLETIVEHTNMERKDVVVPLSI